MPIIKRNSVAHLSPWCVLKMLKHLTPQDLTLFAAYGTFPVQESSPLP